MTLGGGGLTLGAGPEACHTRIDLACMEESARFEFVLVLLVR
jgi:hypothetical protein